MIQTKRLREALEQKESPTTKTLSDSIKLLQGHSEAFAEGYFLILQAKEIFDHMESQKDEIMGWEDELEEIGFDDVHIQLDAFLKRFKKEVIWET